VRRRAVLVTSEGERICARGYPSWTPKRAASTSGAEGPFEQIVDDALTVLVEPSESLNHKNIEIRIDDFLVLSVLVPLLLEHFEVRLVDRWQRSPSEQTRRHRPGRAWPVGTLVLEKRLVLNAPCRIGDTSRRKVLRYQQTAQFRTIQVCPKDAPLAPC
jgi:hypothetical protein